MKFAKQSLAIAVAACSFAVNLGRDSADNAIWIQVTPTGDFQPSDGRDIPVDHWHIDALSAGKIITDFNARANRMVVDYEHQTLLREENGQPAPAAGWFETLEWREGKGLFARVELTARARAYIAGGEYLYFSPVIRYHPTTGVVTGLEMGALTNTAGIDGMEKLDLLAAASFNHQHAKSNTSLDNISLDNPPESTMKELLALLFATLGLAANASQDNAIAALTAFVDKASNDPLVPLRAALGQPADADAASLVSACSALSLKSAPDPAKFVSVAVMRELQDKVAALSTQVQTSGADTLIADALADGRLLEAQKGWAENLAKSDIAALTAYIDNSAPIAALTGQQSKGKKPAAGDDKDTLSADEIAACSAMGIAQADFLKTKGKTKAAAATRH
ncbi:MAG: phage protease [Kordiimonadaceae bacterium]|nr:phage protease [Kordiimonadaceae bacterium]PCJ37762.1 MAG: hypothetical protein COA75_03305 [Cellvibrionales bacterium]